MKYKQPVPTQIIASRENRRFLLKLDSILYFISCDDEIRVVVDNGYEYHVQHPLIFWEKKLESRKFFRCHKGYIVNLEKVKEIIPSFNSTIALILDKHKNAVPVGRKYIKKFKEIVGW